MIFLLLRRIWNRLEKESLLPISPSRSAVWLLFEKWQRCCGRGWNKLWQLCSWQVASMGYTSAGRFFAMIGGRFLRIVRLVLSVAPWGGTIAIARANIAAFRWWVGVGRLAVAVDWLLIASSRLGRGVVTTRGRRVVLLQTADFNFGLAGLLKEQSGEESYNFQ